MSMVNSPYWHMALKRIPRTLTSAMTRTSERAKHRSQSVAVD